MVGLIYLISPLLLYKSLIFTPYQVIQDELLSEEIEQHRASDANFAPPPLQHLQKYFGPSNLESAANLDGHSSQSMAIRSCLRDMYHYARVSGLHILECVMDTSLSAVKREQLQEASNVCVG